MKKLFIIRHAKSSWDNPEMNDFDRPLNNRGIEDAPHMAKRMREKKIHPDLILCSPAARTLATGKSIAAVITYPEHNIKTDKRLYHANDDQILSVLKDIDDKHDVVVIIGHNPGLTEFTNKLLNEGILTIPTCGIVTAELQIDSWRRISFGCGEMEFFDFPKNAKD